MTSPLPPHSPRQLHHLYYPPRKKRVWPWFLLAIPVLLFAGCTAVVASVGSNMDSTAPTTVKRVPAAAVADWTAPTSTLPIAPKTSALPAVPAGPASTITRDGTYLVGVDILPGTWRATGGSGCYWERLSDLTGTLDGIIANELGDGPQFVTILASDRAFHPKRCGTWTLVPE
ncbi:hypothetical protein OG874_00705 [Nocardia sp. NBC_00565]|uniref:hypothetical protein n=1 Tax=Nocardia sp. NBC_00565 TaxID=2975993 RepID=UPI002E80958C|nr:hypothetical protein [Nocardia sp. NBC_00565]WUC03776.1 hypothetical protein OG874_00705 [Nocardia sp. NBC_00565]